jgi:hypothetical protein
VELNQGIQFDFAAHVIQRAPIHDFGPHFSEESFITRRVQFKQVFRDNGIKNSITQKLQSFIAFSMGVLLA